MSSAADLIQRNFGLKDGCLSVGNIPVTDIVKTYGTPLYIYDQGVLERNFSLLRETYPQEFSIYYSIKANPSPLIIKFFLAKGCGLEIASSGELHHALNAGCTPGRILFAGPGKTEAEIEEAIRSGIGELHAESMLEIQRIGRISKNLGVVMNVAIRINPGEEAEGGAMRMGGKATPFGIDEELMEAVLRATIAEKHIHLSGLHLFSGTQILNHETLLRQYGKGLQIAGRFAEELGYGPETIDFGGGLGIPYFAGEKPLDMDLLKKGLIDMMGSFRENKCFEKTRLIIEPGRYLAGEAGIYLARVNDIKVSRGKKFLILDGGMNHHLAASGNLGQTIKRNFPIAIANKLSADSVEKVEVVGPLCTPLDVLARNAELPEADIGDLFAIFQSGAYGRTSSPLGFLSHDAPAEIFIRDNFTELIRTRGDSSN